MAESFKAITLKIDVFLQGKGVLTKYQRTKRRFPRLAVIAIDVGETWLVYLAYLEVLASISDGVEYLLVE